MFNRLISTLHQMVRPVMPIAVYPGLALTGARVNDVTHDAQAQFEAQAAIHQRYSTPVLLSAMDLSVEAEAFGCALSQSDAEIPTVVGQLVTSLTVAEKLEIPEIGANRTPVYLSTISKLRRAYPTCPVLGGCIGPFSLAARLTGVSESLLLTMTQPQLMHQLLEKCTVFLTNYLLAFREHGADGVLMAEPAAGLLSPKSLREFSSVYVSKIRESVEQQTSNEASKEDNASDFTIVLHNCAAKLTHIPSILATGLCHFHFGTPMDLSSAFTKIPDDVTLMGNLDPSAIFCLATAEEAYAKTSELLQKNVHVKRWVLSSGCDLPPETKLDNLDAFFAAAKDHLGTTTDRDTVT